MGIPKAIVINSTLRQWFGGAYGNVERVQLSACLFAIECICFP
jgi:hypothetical protein